MLHTCGIFYNITFERKYKSQEVTVKIYRTENWVLNVSDFMEDMLKNKKTIRFIGDHASHKNFPEENTINTLVTNIWPMEMECAVWI